MKIRLFLLLILLSGTTVAQDFEGTIKWSIKMEITDPKLKAQMEEAEKRMKDPATQAQMKQMQEKLNDPEYKKMMDSNPQMKAQMEAALKMMQGESMNSMVPSGMTMKAKKGSYLSKIEGGAMNGMETLKLKGKEETYFINREEKTYSAVSHNEVASTYDPTVTIKKTTEKQNILNYTCTKNIVTLTEDGQTLTQIFWTTTEIKGLDFKGMADQKMGKGNQAMYYKDLEGVPLKVEMTMPLGTMVMQVTEIKKETLPASDFEIPADFTKM